jgi:hypothetical protein
MDWLWVVLVVMIAVAISLLAYGFGLYERWGERRQERRHLKKSTNSSQQEISGGMISTSSKVRIDALERRVKFIEDDLKNLKKRLTELATTSVAVKPEQTFSGFSVSKNELQTGGIEEQIRGLFNTNPQEIRRRFRVASFGVTNVAERANNPKADPVFGEIDNGDYWLVKTDNGKASYAVPRPGEIFQKAQYLSAAMNRVFQCRGYRADSRFEQVTLERPALFQDAGNGRWDIMRLGEIILSGERPDSG